MPRLAVMTNSNSTANSFNSYILAHLSLNLVNPSSRRPCFSLRATLSDLNISKTSRPIAIKFYLDHHWGNGKAAFGFGYDWMRNLAFMVTDRSHGVKMEKIL